MHTTKKEMWEWMGFQTKIVRASNVCTLYKIIRFFVSDFSVISVVFVQICEFVMYLCVCYMVWLFFTKDCFIVNNNDKENFINE